MVTVPGAAHTNRSSSTTPMRANPLRLARATTWYALLVGVWDPRWTENQDVDSSILSSATMLKHSSTAVGS